MVIAEATVLSRDDSGLRLVLFLSLSFLKPGLLAAGWLLVTALFCNRISPKAELFFAEKLSRFETSPSPVIAILVSLSFRYFNMRVENVLTVCNVKSTPYVEREEAKSSPVPWPVDPKLWMPLEWINLANERMVGGEWTVLFCRPSYRIL